MLPPIIQLMRPKQWVKNVFVFPPLLFSSAFLELAAVGQALTVFFVFCVAASSSYILNDIKDIEADRKHPTKSRSRPLASGSVSKAAAIRLMVALYAVLVVFAFIEPKVMAVIAAYILLNWAYSFHLKNQPVIDIFTIAIGFVLRVYAGAVAIDVPVSGWMFVTTLCLALYLATIKRRQELLHSGNQSRGVLKKYTLNLIDRYAEMSATGALLFYSMFVVSTKPELVMSIPLVLYGLFRYWYIVDIMKGGESPTDVLLKDVQLIVVLALWTISCAISLWPEAG